MKTDSHSMILNKIIANSEPYSCRNDDGWNKYSVNIIKSGVPAILIVEAKFIQANSITPFDEFNYDVRAFYEPGHENDEQVRELQELESLKKELKKTKKELFEARVKLGSVQLALTK